MLLLSFNMCLSGFFIQHHGRRDGRTELLTIMEFALLEKKLTIVGSIEVSQHFFFVITSTFRNLSISQY